jgi:hypothetical protein
MSQFASRVMLPVTVHVTVTWRFRIAFDFNILDKSCSWGGFR